MKQFSDDIMIDETYTIYSVTQPPREKVVSRAEYDEYLSCKFWKKSRKEALLFLCCYFGPVQYESVSRVVGIITGELFEFDNPDDFFNQFNFTEKYKSLLSVISSDKAYPQLFLIDDVIAWARRKELMQVDFFQYMQKEIITARDKVFMVEPSEKLKLDLLKLIVDKSLKFVFYEDIAEILSLDKSVYSEVKTAVEKKEIHFMCHSIDKEFYYFEPTSLLKWLMRYNYFPENWIEHFKDIKIESVKETISHTPKTFTLNQLQSWLEKNYPEDVDIFYHVNNHIYHAYIHAHDESFWFYSKRRYTNQEHSPYKIRYQHLERLISPNNDRANIVTYLLNASTIIADEFTNHVEIAVTDDEYRYELSKFFVLRRKNVCNELRPADLRFIVDEVKQGIKKYKQVTSAATENGKKSGEVRRETRDDFWVSVKEDALKVAIEHKGKSLNKIAGIIHKRAITDKSIRTIGRYIEDDSDFKPYYKLKKTSKN